MFLIDEPFRKTIRVIFQDNKRPPQTIVIPLPIAIGSRLVHIDNVGYREAGENWHKVYDLMFPVAAFIAGSAR